MTTLNVDRPFLFALRDRESGRCFLGRVTDPSIGR